METQKTFTTEEVPLPIRCDVHKWMGAFVGVFPHPYHTVSKGGGSYELKLPAGNYEIVAWHERYGQQSQMVTVAENGKADLNFTFKERGQKHGSPSFRPLYSLLHCISDLCWRARYQYRIGTGRSGLAHNVRLEYVRLPIFKMGRRHFL
jgi:hypothetical protein